MALLVVQVEGVKLLVELAHPVVLVIHHQLHQAKEILVGLGIVVRHSIAAVVVVARALLA
jgi:hypothetical protein